VSNLRVVDPRMQTKREKVVIPANPPQGFGRISLRLKRESSHCPPSKNLIPQIHPIWILLLDQFQLPGAVPLFYVLFPSYGGQHVLV